MTSYRRDHNPRRQRSLERSRSGGKPKAPRPIRPQAKASEPKEPVVVDPRIVCLQCPDEFPDTGKSGQHPHIVVILEKPWDGSPIHLGQAPIHPDDFFMSYVVWEGRYA